MSYRILDDPNIPNELKGLAAAQAIADAEARAQAETARRESRIQAEIQRQEVLATINREREEREKLAAERKRDFEPADVIQDFSECRFSQNKLTGKGCR